MTSCLSVSPSQERKSRREKRPRIFVLTTPIYPTENRPRLNQRTRGKKKTQKRRRNDIFFFAKSLCAQDASCVGRREPSFLPPSNPWSEFASLPPTRIKERRIPINYAREDFSPKTRRGIVSLALVPSGVTGKRPIFNTSRGREGGGGHEPLFRMPPRGQVERDNITKFSEEFLKNIYRTFGAF